MESDTENRSYAAITFAAIAIVALVLSLFYMRARLAERPAQMDSEALQALSAQQRLDAMNARIDSLLVTCRPGGAP